ncbi:probable zinc transporter protein DDB_G0269332 [Vigna radiata var. radiata]|uniref:Probable zinc transporter protein DDB_G0269332 n=1 Tax=Vigna radiata var. radiata TaxID=3916 RepID=A0A3Q0FBZ2_VIGRR|nr:probable zinc transporter protein DDB_G0269332 [Vigna radiata var. radiata]
MEGRERKPTKMSVPQFGGWEHKAAGVPTDYSMVFSQARANRKTQKTELTEVKRLSLGNERDNLNGNHRHGNVHGHTHGHTHTHEHGHAHGPGPSHRHDKEDPPFTVSP